MSRNRVLQHVIHSDTYICTQSPLLQYESTSCNILCMCLFVYRKRSFEEEDVSSPPTSYVSCVACVWLVLIMACVHVRTYMCPSVCHEIQPITTCVIQWVMQLNQPLLVFSFQQTTDTTSVAGYSHQWVRYWVLHNLYVTTLCVSLECAHTYTHDLYFLFIALLLPRVHMWLRPPSLPHTPEPLILTPPHLPLTPEPLPLPHPPPRMCFA